MGISDEGNLCWMGYCYMDKMVRVFGEVLITG